MVDHVDHSSGGADNSFEFAVVVQVNHSRRRQNPSLQRKQMTILLLSPVKAEDTMYCVLAVVTSRVMCHLSSSVRRSNAQTAPAT